MCVCVLLSCLQAFAAFGTGSGTVDPDVLDNARFAKLATECGLVSKDCNKTDVDIIFSQAKPKGSRKLNFEQFKRALALVGAHAMHQIFGQFVRNFTAVCVCVCCVCVCAACSCETISVPIAF